MRYKIYLSTFLLWFLCSGVLAQTGDYKFTRLNNTQGLLHNQINCILEDSQGFMWFGTMSGLNRFDGYNFKAFRHDVRDSTSIRNNYISNLAEGPEQMLLVVTRWSGLNIYNPRTERFLSKPDNFLRKYGVPDASVEKVIKDQQGNFWFVHTREGIFKYDSHLRKTIRLAYSTADSLTIHSNQISDITEDGKGNLWLMHYDGVLEKISKTGKVIFRNYFLNRKFGQTSQGYGLFSDADGDAWIFMNNEAKGLFYFDAKKQVFTHIHHDSDKVKLNANIVRGVTQDNRHRIWVGTDHGGINLLDKKTFTVRYLVNEPDDFRSLSQNSVYSVYTNKAGIVWVGTYKEGVNYYHPDVIRFKLYQHLPANTASLPFNDINRVVEDAKGNLWLGTNGGGLIYFDRANNQFKQFQYDANDPNSLSNNIIVGLHLDRDQKLWIGTYFGGLNVYDGQKFTRYRHNPDDPSSLSDDRVWEIFEDAKRNLWVGTLGGGLDLLDRKTNTFRHHRSGRPNSVHSDFISSITEDREGYLWVATAFGVDQYNPATGVFKHFVNRNNNPQGLSNNNVTTVIEDSRGLIWMGTNEGLNLYDKRCNAFRSFRQEDGLLDNSILGIVEDNQHNLWVSTPKGLSSLIIGRKQDGGFDFSFKSYDQQDGLQDKAFNNNAAWKTKRGELVFGGADGFNIFQPERITRNKAIPVLVFTDFEIFNRSIGVGDTLNGRVVLEKAITGKKEITLKYHENMFSVAFAALDYLQPEKNRYVYHLDGFSDEWLAVDSKLRKVTFTNLDPGNYVLRVKAANNDGIWNQEGIQLKITILPPFWQSKPAIAAYVMVVLLLLWLARHFLVERERLRFRIVQERQEAKRRHELDVMKIKFFTNVSHEFRTPLTLILTPLEKIIKNTTDEGQKSHLLLMHRNARRLLNLVNQLLDFRRMEVQEIHLQPTKADIICFIKETAFSFSDLSEKKNIRFNLVSEVEQLEILFDPDKLEKILFNLLSNAFKFTPEGGEISLNLHLTAATRKNGKSGQQLIIKVKDSGIGIPAENHEKIFRQFFQSDVPGSMVNQGSGIGLAITKKFVRLHGGTITVQSQPGEGSCFTVVLPVAKAFTAKAAPEPVVQEIQQSAALPVVSDLAGGAMAGSKNGKKPVVLLIEDNEDFRFYLKDNLQAYYTIKEAADGKQGWQQVLACNPDLVVSDIMMPEMDGITLSRKLKKDPRTANIPVILLTANASEEQQMVGYQTGASDYIVKPFNFEILLSRIRNLVNQHANFREALQPKIEVKPQEVQVTSLDDKLIRKAIAYTEKNISNPDFSVEDLSREMGMSRVYLYKKLLALTGKAPLEFIRTVRLKRAAQLLTESQLTVSEVAYEVGFNNPKYFTKYFKVEFNCLPSAYAAEKKKEASMVLP
ncbi:two-component regulator propeller domain-containing protein [Adhaeribacter aerolatus]|nr:two-component regulator propeller domain-containing protein [Adhaeribacter aerolatus]